MAEEIIAAKVGDGALYPDLREGFVMGIVIPCPWCKVSYRLFYPTGEGVASPSVITVATKAASLEESIGSSHPEHPDRLRLVA